MNIEFGPGELFRTDCSGEFQKLGEVKDMIVEQTGEHFEEEIFIPFIKNKTFQVSFSFSSFVKSFWESPSKGGRLAHLVCHNKKYRVRKKNLRRIYERMDSLFFNERGK